MRVRIPLACLVAATVFVPALTSAVTLAELQAQMQALITQIATIQADIQKAEAKPVQSVTATSSNNPVFTICPALTRTLARGSMGDDVANLQGFLQERGAFTASVTAYFGIVTEGALQKWQATQGLYPSGIADGTTRAAISELCADTVSVSNADQLACRVTPPARSCNGAWKATLNARGCPTLWRCAPPEILLLPQTFSAYPYSGLPPLKVTFYASFSRGSKYSVDFGDGTSSPMIYGTGCPASSVAGCQNDASVTHTYASSSTYLVKFFSTVGVAATTTITVANTSIASPIVAPTALKATPLSGASPLRVSFSTQQPFNASTLTATNYYVDFGDGTSGYMGAPNTCASFGATRCTLEWTTLHTYAAVGTYAARLHESVDCRGMLPCPAASQRVIATSTITVR